MAGENPLPLFPLEVVLFPGTQLPLHIFEERYRLMIGEAVDRHSEFGVILQSGGKLASIGCAAIVERVTHRYDDGRFDVEARGRQRFKTVSLDESLAYLQARVEYFKDTSQATADPARLQQALDFANQVAELLQLQPLKAETSVPQPSFHLAHALPLELSFKQRLLARKTEAERLGDLTEYLPKVVERLKLTQRVRRQAGTNGRGRAH